MKVDMAAVVEKWESWWERRNEEPVFYLIFPEGERELGHLVKDWMSPSLVEGWSNWKQELLFGQAFELVRETGEDRYVEEALDYLEAYIDVTGFAGEGYPFLLPGFGPSCLAGFVSGVSKFAPPTIWFELEEAMGWAELGEVGPETETAYSAGAWKHARRLVERLQEHYVMAMPDLGSGLDILSSLRKPENLLLDLYDCPGTVRGVCEGLHGLWRRHWDAFVALVGPGNHEGYAETMRYLSAAPTHIGYCDFSAMISPAMFEEFVLPGLAREGAACGGRMVYHLDGPGQLGHVELLCGLEDLHAIQWVSGAGNPGGLSEAWDGLYRQILDGGKRVCLSGVGSDPGALKAFFERFPAQEFVVVVTLGSRAEAEALLAVRGG
jgi:5-methyltetrahydrofolate--homocysteine methyltransferase